MADITQVWDHVFTIEVAQVSGGTVNWRDIHTIRESDDPTSKQLAQFDSRHSGYATQGTVTIEQQQGNQADPARMRFSGGLNTNGELGFTVRTAEEGGTNIQDYRIEDVAPRMLSAEQMASASANRINGLNIGVNAFDVEIAPDVWETHMLADVGGVITDVAFIQLTHTLGDDPPAGPD